VLEKSGMEEARLRRQAAGGEVRGLNRAEDVASPQGQKGIENAESKIDKKNNPKNPNTTDSDKETKK
jgi:hypothetical protein